MGCGDRRQGHDFVGRMGLFALLLLEDKISAVQTAHGMCYKIQLDGFVLGYMMVES